MTPLLGALGASLALGFAGWLVSLWRRDASVADVFWGPLFVVIALTTLALGPHPSARASIVLGGLTLWAVRLTWHLLQRNLGAGEDRRYRALRERYGASFWIVSLPLVFVLQPVLAWVVAAPVMAAILQPGGELGPLDLLGALLFTIGLLFETVADLELRRFQRDPANRERVLDWGLFRYCRHPNYFGEFVLWWGLGAFGVAAGSVPSLVGPLLLTGLLLRVSGVTLLESTITSRRPGYATYKQRTNAFFPGPPRRTA